MPVQSDITPLLNKGVLPLNPPAPAGTERTLVVLGAPRGGTTMVAGCLHHLGVPMGVEEDSAIFEDAVLGETSDRGQWRRFRRRVRALNGEYETWGWKRPMAYLHARRIERILRNPHFVAVFRDPLAIGLRESISMELDPWFKFDKALDTFREISGFLRESQSPTMAVSYEKAVKYPTYFLETLRDFAGLPEDTSIQSALNFIDPEPERYLLDSHRRTDLSL